MIEYEMKAITELKEMTDHYEDSVWEVVQGLTDELEVSFTVNEKSIDLMGDDPEEYEIVSEMLNKLIKLHYDRLGDWLR